MVAYDIKIINAGGKSSRFLLNMVGRINLSVFECMLGSKQLFDIETEISKVINPKEDQVVFYPLCLNCFAKAVYIPDVKHVARFTIIA